jgi:PadR family transcriptional regulator, regulatory protein PadR
MTSRGAPRDPLSHDTQLLKGVLSLVLLRLLADRESYGYELVASVRALGLPDVGEGSIYPALSRLERDGLLASRRVAGTDGPPRKYYRLAPKGDGALRERTAAWEALLKAVGPLLRSSTPDRLEARA